VTIAFGTKGALSMPAFRGAASAGFQAKHRSRVTAWGSTRSFDGSNQNPSSGS